MEVRRPRKGKRSAGPNPDPDRAAWEGQLTKRYKCSPDWIDDEKAVVADALSTGRKSVAELTRRLEGSKSLRQVAEYVERLELWSRVLGPLDPDMQPPPEAEEVIGWFVLEEERSAAAAAQREDEEAAGPAGKPGAAGIPLRYRRHDRLIDAECASLLAKIAGHTDKAGATRKVGAFVGQALEEFLRKVLHELAISGKLASTAYGHLQPAGAVEAADVGIALERCRLPPTQPVQTTFRRFARRHLLDRVFHELYEPESPPSSEPEGPPSSEPEGPPSSEPEGPPSSEPDSGASSGPDSGASSGPDSGASSGPDSGASSDDSQRRGAGTGPGDRDPRGLGIADQER